MGLRGDVQNSLNILENLNKDFYPNEVNGAITALAAYVAAVDNVVTDYITVDSTSAVTSNSEAGVISLSSSYSQSLVPGTQFPITFNNSYVTSTTPCLFSVNTSGAAGMFSSVWAQSAGVVSLFLVAGIGYTAALTSLHINYHIITPRTSGD